MATDAAVLQIIDAYNTRNGVVRARVLDFVQRQWGGLSNWRAADIDRFVQAVVPVVEAGQLQVAAITDGYLAAIESVVTGQVVAPIGVAPEVVSDLVMRGVPTANVYARTGPTVWTALSNGANLQAAVAGGLERALVATANDLQLAHTHAGRDVMARKPQVVGYRRVLTGAASCRLCVTASTQRYHKAELMPVHGRCDCKVLPIIGEKDPGQTINKEVLASLKESGNAGDLALTQARGRARAAVSDAEARIGELTDQLADAQPGERRRIEQQIEDARARKEEAERQVKRRQDQLDDYRGLNGKPKTVIVHEHGELGPTLTDRDHKFTSPADLG